MDIIETRVTNGRGDRDSGAVRKKRPKVKKRTWVILAAAIVVVDVAAFVLILSFVIHPERAPIRYDPAISVYKDQIILPNCSLYFLTSRGRSFSEADIDWLSEAKSVPLTAEWDVSKQFGSNPLKNVWMPHGFRIAFADNSDNKNVNYSNALFDKNMVLRGIIYNYTNDSADTGAPNISITISHKAPLMSYFTPVDDDRASHIYSTELKIKHMPAGIVQGAVESFEAVFIYRGTGYVVYAYNGVSQAEFVNVLFSIIRS